MNKAEQERKLPRYYYDIGIRLPQDTTQKEYMAVINRANWAIRKVEEMLVLEHIGSGCDGTIRDIQLLDKTDEDRADVIKNFLVNEGFTVEYCQRYDETIPEETKPACELCGHEIAPGEDTIDAWIFTTNWELDKHSQTGEESISPVQTGEFIADIEGGRDYVMVRDACCGRALRALWDQMTRSLQELKEQRQDA